MSLQSARLSSLRDKHAQQEEAEKIKEELEVKDEKAEKQIKKSSKKK